MTQTLGATADELIASLREITADPTVAGIEIVTTFDTPNHTVTPPAGHVTVYENRKLTAEMPGLFDLPDGTKGVSLDTWASQANRVEQALKDLADAINYPLFVVSGIEDIAQTPITSLDWPHRHADAHWRLLASAPEVTAEQIPVDAIARATIDDAGVLLEHFPASVLLGWWHARSAAKDKATAAKNVPADVWEAVQETTHRTMAEGRSARVLSSEIIAKGVTVREVFAARMDPFGALPGGDTGGYSAVGLGTIPPSHGPRTVFATAIEGRAFLSLAYLRRFRFGDEHATADGRTLIAALALLGYVHADHDLHLRTGTDLRVLNRIVKIDRPGTSTPVEIPDEPVLVEAVRTLGKNVGWAGRRTLTATTPYRKVLELARGTATS